MFVIILNSIIIFTASQISVTDGNVHQAVGNVNRSAKGRYEPQVSDSPYRDLSSSRRVAEPLQRAENGILQNRHG